MAIKREKVFSTLKVFKDFRNYLGNAYLNFSDPIDLDEFLKSQTENYLIDSPQEKPQWVDKATSDLGKKLLDPLIIPSRNAYQSLLSSSIN